MTSPGKPARLLMNVVPILPGRSEAPTTATRRGLNTASRDEACWERGPTSETAKAGEASVGPLEPALELGVGELPAPDAQRVEAADEGDGGRVGRRDGSKALGGNLEAGRRPHLVQGDVGEDLAQARPSPGEVHHA